jgi:tetratricopeptide (TPR) repeat protein
LISFSIFWFFLALLPESSFLPLQDVIFEHRLYLPMAGYSIFLVSSVYYLFGRKNIKTMVSILMAIIICNSVLTYQRNSIWKNEITLLNDVIQKSPHKERPYNNRGLAFDKQRDLARAISDFTQAIAINPLYTNAHINRGFMYNKQGKFTEAIFDYSKAIEINPKLAEAYIDRGNVYIKSGNFKQAVSDFEKAIKISPDKPYFADTYYNLGFIYYKQGNFTQAAANYSKVIVINPKDTEAYNNRAVSYFQLKEYDKAWGDVDKAEELGAAVNPQLISALKQVTGRIN